MFPPVLQPEVLPAGPARETEPEMCSAAQVLLRVHLAYGRFRGDFTLPCPSWSGLHGGRCHPERLSTRGVQGDV